MIETFGGRKAFLTLFILAVCLGVVAIKGDVPENLKSIIEWLFGAFVIGNSFNTVSSAVASGRAAKVEIANITAGNVPSDPTTVAPSQEISESLVSDTAEPPPSPVSPTTVTHTPAQSPEAPAPSPEALGPWTPELIAQLAQAIGGLDAKMNRSLAQQQELLNTMTMNQRALSILIERATGAKGV